MIRCEYCRRRLTEENCTMISQICDDCLADEAAENRNDEMACELAIVFRIGVQK